MDYNRFSFSAKEKRQKRKLSHCSRGDKLLAHSLKFLDAFGLRKKFSNAHFAADLYRRATQGAKLNTKYRIQTKKENLTKW